MWYFTWILGLGFSVLFAAIAAMWIEAQETQRDEADR